MKNIQKKRGFTIVELVIVIAVIAILAAVLIPTFSNVIARAKVSADTQLCRNLNTVLTMATSEGRIPGSMYDVLYLASESGYLIGNLNPTAEGYYFAWDAKAQKIVYIRDDLTSVMYPEDYKLDPASCWVTVGNKAEAELLASKGYNLYLENDIEEITLTNTAVSIDTGAYTLRNLTVEGSSDNVKSVVLSGNFGSTDLSITNTSFSNTGSISSLSVGTNVAAVSINGSVGSLASNQVNSTITMSSAGAIGSINGTGSVTNTNGATFSSADTVISGSINADKTGSVAIKVSSKEAIENIRTQLAGGRNFKGETVELANDINMAGIAFQPLSNYDRDNKTNSDTANWFQGTFDGQGHTIKNFSTNGFAIAGLNAGTNKSSVVFGGTTYSEAVYGLLGTVYVPEGETVTIKNLKIEVAVDMVTDDGNKYVGDSVGGLIGFAYGKGTLRIEDVTISGTVNGYDAVGAFIGRAYGETKGKTLNIEFVNCTNNATVNGVRHTGAFIGYANNTAKTTQNYVAISFENCVNNGKITSLGIEKDQELGANATGTNGSGYYTKGLYVGTNNVQYGLTTEVEGITNNGSFGDFYTK